MFNSINPYDGRIVFQNAAMHDEEIETAVSRSHEAFSRWRSEEMKERSRLMSQLADVLETHAAAWGRIITLEMGKPLAQSMAEIRKCAWVCRYYAENAATYLQLREIATDAHKSSVRYDPLGPILGVMPWNFPFWQVFRFAVPTVMAGNTVLLKHASNVMECACTIGEAFRLAGFPENVFTNLPVGSNKVEGILRNPRVKGVSLTGSKPAGSAVASVAGQEIKPSLLELGGSNALVVFADCAWEETLQTCIMARFLNAGQSCIAGKRLLVQRNIYREFVSALKQETEALVTGDPLGPEVFMGPLVNEEAAIELERQLNESLNGGARLITGGKRKGAFFEPTLVENVSPDSVVFREETFGPLLACVPFDTDEEAVGLVNASEFGLGVSIFTTNSERIDRLIPLFNEGAVFVNELVKSDPRMPFGGVKISGYGRELAREGILAFVNTKTVWVK